MFNEIFYGTYDLASLSSSLSSSTSSITLFLIAIKLFLTDNELVIYDNYSEIKSSDLSERLGKES